MICPTVFADDKIKNNLNVRKIFQLQFLQDHTQTIVFRGVCHVKKWIPGWFVLGALIMCLARGAGNGV